MIDHIALWLGYDMLLIGGFSLVIAIAMFAIWQAFEAWWRWGEHWKRLREFIEWKRGRYPG